MDLGWFETAGKGVIHNYVVVEQPIVGALIGAVPDVVAIIELDDCKEEDGTVTRVAGVPTHEDRKPRSDYPARSFTRRLTIQIVMPR